jgi:hypothetical protein
VALPFVCWPGAERPPRALSPRKEITVLGLTQLWQAVGALAANVNALAQTVNEVNAAVRGRLQLDVPDQPAALDHEPAAGNGAGRRKRASA